MKTLLAFSIILAIGLSSYSQCLNNESLSERIKSEAEAMANALITKNHEAYINYMHPVLIEAFGGKVKVLETLNQGILHGAEIKSIEFSNQSEPINYLNEIQCTFNQTIIMKYNENKILTNSTLIGISMDNGNRWYFIDAGSNTLIELQGHFPNLSDRLIIKPLSKPLLIKE
ncbi:hypothetical protein [Alkalitalea saponilacus]|uniref:Uncharacterized protein n=1 Tax=Alkalitalea saponilacus TaxID=889453 RepID=A0A1T5HUC8_9BACT|nr:hypothetical protein [Alkalitalea saponilacus]ASB50434.1 hypothetical protein CDL62_15400 [Alkalitalea saponilacus]SKC24292.1 hypothetical protein SAMN03080601_03591 [Alkalitalea saponilacus]